MELFAQLFWILPASIWTLWTVSTAVVAWVHPLNTKVHFFFGSNALLMFLNPKDEYLYTRPSMLRVMLFIAVGWIPLGGLLLLGFNAYCAIRAVLSTRHPSKSTG